MNFWLHRISHHAEVSFPLLEKKGYLSTGWSGIDNLVEMIRNHDYFGKYFSSYPKPRSRFSLHKFIYEMKKGDFVLVPYSGHFSIYEIAEDSALVPNDLEINDLKDWSKKSVVIGVGDKLYVKNGDSKDSYIDLGFFRKVKPIAISIPRSKFADQALISRMKSRETTLQINDLSDSLISAIDNFNKNKPIDLHSIILENFISPTLNLIRKNIDDLKFEKLVKWYFEKSGADKVEILAKNESNKKGDADIVATFESIRTMIYVQAKKHEGNTSDWALEQISDYISYKTEAVDDEYTKIGWVISTADNYSDKCITAAKIAKVQLINGKEFVQLLLENGIGDLDSAFYN